MNRRPDCEHCDWRNGYHTCQDGSREYAAYEHARTHSREVEPLDGRGTE